MLFSHFLITQFNLRNFPTSSFEDNKQWIEWTRERIQLFKTYCLPSILNQTEKNFTWLIFFDTKTPSEFEQFVNGISKHSCIEICYCPGSEGFQDDYLNEIQLRIRKETKWIITTRLDNDDILHKDAVKLIQQNFIEKDKFLISLASGYAMDVRQNILAHYFYPMSPFISLTEKASPKIIGIFSKSHTHWSSLRLFLWKEIYFEYINKSHRQSRFILKHPLWIQIVHGKNLSNSFYRGLPVTRSIDLVDFGLNQVTKKMSLKEINKFYNYVVWKRYFKCTIIKVLLGK